MLKVTKTGDLLPSKSNDFNIVQTFKPRTNHLPLLGPNLFFAKNVESNLRNQSYVKNVQPDMQKDCYVLRNCAKATLIFPKLKKLNWT